MPELSPQPKPAVRPWGPGGYEISVTADDEFALVNLLQSVPTACTLPTARRIAQYARGLDHFRASGGPHDAAAVGRALRLPKGAVHDLLNVQRTRWNAKALRRKLLVAFMPNDVLGVVLNLLFTESDHSSYMIVTAHAFGARWRILLGVQRVQLGQSDQEKYGREALVARQRIVDEITQVLHQRRLEPMVPVLTGDTTVGQTLLPYLVEADQLSYLAEIDASWSYGGLVTVAELEATTAPLRAGGTMRELFRPDPAAGEMRACDVVPTAYTQLLGQTAIASGPYPHERFFIARVHGHPGAELQAQGGMRRATELARDFASEDLTGVADGYGLPRFNRPGDECFQRHCTTLTLRDCFAAKSLVA
jgi:hypothetical protein